jgi:hypothetical protein
VLARLRAGRYPVSMRPGRLARTSSLVLSLVIAGCVSHRSLSWEVRFERATDRALATRVSAQVLAGSCAAPTDVVLYTAPDLIGAPVPMGRTLPDGRYAFAATAYDESGAEIASGCTDVSVPSDTSSIVTSLRPSSALPDGGPRDAGIDAPMADAPIDAPIADAPIDAPIADAPRADARDGDVDAGADAARDAGPRCDMCSCSTDPVLDTSFDEGTTSEFTGCSRLGTGVFEVFPGFAHVAAAPASATEAVRASCFLRGPPGTMAGSLVFEGLRFQTTPTFTAGTIAPIGSIFIGDSAPAIIVYVNADARIQANVHGGLSGSYGGVEGTSSFGAGVTHDVRVDFEIDPDPDDGVSEGRIAIYGDGVLEDELTGLSRPNTFGCATNTSIGTGQIDPPSGWAGEIDFTVQRFAFLRAP